MKQLQIMQEVMLERGRQDLMWGTQEHDIKPHKNTDSRYFIEKAEKCKKEYEIASKNGIVTWYHILKEEFYEIFAENEPSRQRHELIQVMAVAMAMVEYLDRRFPEKDHES